MSKDNSVFQYIIAPIVVAILIGGTAPWWWQEFFADKPTTEKTSRPEEGYAPGTGESYEENTPAQTTSISVLYRGDYLYCTLNVDIVVGGMQAAFVQQNKFVVNGLEAGSQLYSISGQVVCPQAGSCLLGGQGTIDVVEDGTYYLVWQGGTGTSQCVAALNS